MGNDGIINSVLCEASYNQWVQVNPTGWRPSGRYKHAAQVVEEKLYVIGGSRNGRYLSDVQVFDIRALKWSSLSLSTPSDSSLENTTSHFLFPALAGHSLVNWENKLLIVAGHSKDLSDIVQVWSIDLETNSYSTVQTYGKVPIARGGQSVNIVGSKLIMFGGEDRRRRLLNDLHILDLTTMTWEIVEAENSSPSPRFDHTAAVLADEYLLIFGGSSHSTCFNDLYLLDLRTMEWSQPDSQGAYVTPRGGHAGTKIDENWYIVGGGDNKTGATETIILNTNKYVWSVATSVKERDPLASEGLTLCSATLDGEKLIVSFGGYNGKYNNEVFVMKVTPREFVQPRLLQSPAAAAAAASVTAAYALITSSNMDIINMKNLHDSNVKADQIAKSLKLNADALNAEKSILMSKLSEVRGENSMLSANIEEMNNSHGELLKELQSVQGQLAAERERCLKFEAQIAVMHKNLESLGPLEHELEVLRNQKSQIEKEMDLPQRQSSGGVWQWITGTT